ncbi:hypothetical protein D9757_007330 [Collybiopsis confluens]|uniref:G protein-coupled receptor 89 n=1 Tax=Collybiopsis confluens TaxID=2823264 RepID=A0A8H5HFZ3_9AGAR|nr:hypothetical protein D9757_007330 [Collybiopsis confluens]
MSIVIESVVLILIRIALFLSCRSYILKRLYFDLQSISTSASDEHDNIELDSLPVHTPTSATTPNPHQPSGRNFTVSQAVFAGCFSESCILFVLLMCQGLNVFEPRTRLIHWKFSLLTLLITILILSPLIVTTLVTINSQKKLSVIRILVSLIPSSLCLFALSRIPLPEALRVDSQIDLITSSLARLLVFGTIILGLLSGFGAVSYSWAYLPSCISSSRGQGVPSDRDIEQAERALERVSDDLAARRRQLATKTSSSDGGAPSSAGASWYSRMVPTLRGSSDDEAEITGLRLLYGQMDRSLSALKRRKSDDEFNRTLKGRVYGFIGMMMAIYWAARIVWTTINVLIFRPFFASSPALSSSTNYPDLISKLLADFAAFVHRHRFQSHDLDLDPSLGSTPADLGQTQEQIKIIARQISLLFVGLVILTSIRMVLRGVSRIISRMTKLKLKRNLAASVMLILLAQLMGTYLLTTIVQLRTSFPPPDSSRSYDDAVVMGDSGSDSNLFSTVPPFQVFGTLFDGSFLSAAAASIAVRWMGSKIGEEWNS